MMNDLQFDLYISHNGKIFVYSSLEYINEQYFQLVIKDFVKTVMMNLKHNN